MKPRLSRRTLPLIIRTITIFLCICSFLWIFSQHANFQSLTQFQPTINSKCVVAVQSQNITNYNLGFILQHHQLAAFIASVFHLPFSIPSIHGQPNEYSSIFSNCPVTTDNPSRCTLNHRNLSTPRCEPGDCACLQTHLNHYIHPITQSCPSITVIPTNNSTTQFSGCLRTLLLPFLSNTTKPPFSYDVIYYRRGPIGTNSSKEFDLHQLAYMVRALCRLSDRRIVVITDKVYRIPSCEDRIVLGAGLSMRESMRVMRYGSHIGVSGDEMAVGMMEIAEAERVVLFEKAVRYYEWVKCEKWTILGKFGEMYHFDEKEMMKTMVLRRPKLEALGYGKQKTMLLRDAKLEWPVRRWETERNISVGKEELAS